MLHIERYSNRQQFRAVVEAIPGNGQAITSNSDLLLIDRQRKHTFPINRIDKVIQIEPGEETLDKIGLSRRVGYRKHTLLSYSIDPLFLYHPSYLKI